MRKDEIVAIAAKTGAEAAIEALKKMSVEQNKQQHDQRFRNTKLLLRNYHQLNAYVKYAKFDDGVVEIQSKPFRESKLMVYHMNRMIDVYLEGCATARNGEEARRGDVLRMLFLDTKTLTIAEVAAGLFTDKRTIYRDRNAIIEQLTILFFGIPEELSK